MPHFSFSLSNLARLSLSRAQFIFSLSLLQSFGLCSAGFVRSRSLSWRRGALAPPLSVTAGVQSMLTSVYPESPRALVETFRRFRIVAPRRVAIARSCICFQLRHT